MTRPAPSACLTRDHLAKAQRAFQERELGLRIVKERLRVEFLWRTLPLDRCLAELARTTNSQPTDPERVERIGVWTARLLRNRRWTGTTCLQRALTRFSLLSQEGARPTFIMGLNPELDVEGHAWIELEGQPWFEPPLPPIVPTFRYPEPQ